MYFIRKPRILPPTAIACTYRKVHIERDPDTLVETRDVHEVRFQVLGDRAVTHDNWSNWMAGNLEEAREEARMLLRLGYSLVREPVAA